MTEGEAARLFNEVFDRCSKGPSPRPDRASLALCVVGVGAKGAPSRACVGPPGIWSSCGISPPPGPKNRGRVRTSSSPSPTRSSPSASRWSRRAAARIGCTTICSRSVAWRRSSAVAARRRSSISTSSSRARRALRRTGLRHAALRQREMDLRRRPQLRPARRESPRAPGPRESLRAARRRRARGRAARRALRRHPALRRAKGPRGSPRLPRSAAARAGSLARVAVRARRVSEPIFAAVRRRVPGHRSAAGRGVDAPRGLGPQRHRVARRVARARQAVRGRRSEAGDLPLSPRGSGDLRRGEAARRGAGGRLLHLASSFRGVPALQAAQNAAFATQMPEGAPGVQAVYVPARPRACSDRRAAGARRAPGAAPLRRPKPHQTRAGGVAAERRRGAGEVARGRGRDVRHRARRRGPGAARGASRVPALPAFHGVR
jgi:hypothetical protein